MDWMEDTPGVWLEMGAVAGGPGAPTPAGTVTVCGMRMTPGEQRREGFPEEAGRSEETRMV